MNHEDRDRRLGEEPIAGLFFKLAVPAVTGMLVQALYNIVDRYFIANIEGIGETAIGGVGVSIPVIFVLIAFSMLFGIGTAANISLNMGRQKYDEAEKVLGTGIFCLFVSGLVLSTLFLLNLDFLLNLYGASESNITYARDYLGIFLVGNYWNLLAFGLSHMIRSEGNSKMAMISMLVGAISNIVLDAVFIQVFGMGVKGAAYATIIAQFLSFACCALYYLLSKSSVRFKFSNFRPDYKLIAAIVSIGFSPFFIQIAGSVIGGMTNNSLRHYGGDIANSAYAVVNSITTLFLMPVFGMTQALQPIIGYNYGAKNYGRVRKVIFIGIISAGVFLLAATVVTLMFTRQIVSTMAYSAELIEASIPAVRMMLMLITLVTIQIIATTMFQSIGRAKHAFVMSLSRQVFCLVPLILILPRFFGLNGVWMAMPIADALSFVLGLFMLSREFRVMDTLEAGHHRVAEA